MSPPSPWRVDGYIAGVTGLAVNLSGRERSAPGREQAIVDMEQAQRLARLGYWTWDPITDRITWSPQVFEIYARDPALGPPSREEVRAYVHPDDAERVRRGFASHLGREPKLTYQYRIITGEGEEKVVRVLGRADPTRPGGYIGTVQDVTDERGR